MNILYIADQIYRSSGVSVWCVEICEKLLEWGHTIRLALQQPDYHNPYPVSNKVMLTTIDEVYESLENATWDVVHINGIWNWPYHKVARIAYKRGIPVVWSPHGSLTPWALNHKRLKKEIAWVLYMRRDLARASILHVTAKSEVEDMRRLGLKNEVAIAPLGVKFRWSVDELREIKRKTKRKIILFVSRVHPKKGIDNLMKAWASLKHSSHMKGLDDWNVKIVGNESYPDYVRSLKKLSVELGVAKDFEFCGARYGEEKDMCYAEAKLFVLPSHSENFGAVVVEALANGTPVITTKGTPWGGLVDNKCGWWIDFGVEPLVETLRASLALSEEELIAMGERGLEWMKREYDWTTIASRMQSIYERLLVAKQHN